MVDAKSLRIGNWVEEEVLGRVQVNLVTDGIAAVICKRMRIDKSIVDDQYTINTENLTPIPLTPEILISCGFEKEERGNTSDFDGIEIVYHLSGIDIYDHRDNGGGFSFATYTRYPGRGFKGGHSVETLHQLQNIFHSLTAQELSYNPSTPITIK